ncbi:hypothetical protein BASA84_000607 [Batrachochytrium salamandrivorans]|nr:hypothetical protein BASA81_013383 [Batrachochytrium salamandrivorans]KAH9248928.1 hypothetical protein BASA81_013385 [Batrachochytrium salamandrivorans]KAH9267555.1 hypothetical protein BASA84_000607 [Batrachochytrium salamandrivorans]
MQLFHLFSFVVVASYAAALPQPAGLSEKYSNNVDTNLVSGLEARSYQPVLNSYKESATLMSLERRANSGSDSSPPPVTAPENRFMDDFDGRDIFDMGIFSEVLASTISEVGDGSTGVFKKGELAIQKIGGDAGDLVAKYIRREAYVNVALLLWSYFQIATVLSTIKSGLGDGQYSKIEPNLVAKIVELKNTLEAGLNAAVDATTKILNEEGTVIENVEKISTSFYSASSACREIFSELKVQLLKFRAGSTLSGHLTEASQSVSWFNIGQFGEHREMMKALRAAFPQ